jgi:hypothetical protein
MFEFFNYVLCSMRMIFKFCGIKTSYYLILAQIVFPLELGFFAFSLLIFWLI